MTVFFSSITAEAAQPRVAIVGFTSRVHKTDITLTDLKEPLDDLLSVARDQLTTELAGEQKFALYDFGEQTQKARRDEAAFVDALGEGTIAPELAGKADYYVFGYLTTLGKVKAQSGALGLSGRDKTVYAELSLRVMDAHGGHRLRDEGRLAPQGGALVQRHLAAPRQRRGRCDTRSPRGRRHQPRGAVQAGHVSGLEDKA